MRTKVTQKIGKVSEILNLLKILFRSRKENLPLEKAQEGAEAEKEKEEVEPEVENKQGVRELFMKAHVSLKKWARTRF